MSDATTPVDFQVLLEKAPSNYLILDPQLRIVAVSDAYCRVTLTERETILGRGIFEVFPDDEARPNADGVQNLRSSLQRVVTLKRPDAMATQRYDIERPASEGGGFMEKYWSPLNAPVLDESGNLLWIIHRVRDITKSVLNPNTDSSRQHLELHQSNIINQLRLANEELSELNELRAKLMKVSRLNTVAIMASALAHDVLQPLTAARNYLSALKRTQATQGDASERTQELVQKIGEQIERAGDIVKGLRAFMSAGATNHSAENMELVIAGAARLSESVIKAARAELRLEIAPGIPPIAMDRVQIQQVLLNLLTNAADAVTGQDDRVIVIASRAARGLVTTEVSDTGGGLSHEVAQHIFKPFGSTKANGMGLGLPICQQIIAEHHGTISARPRLSRGTIFSFSIPYSGANASA